MARSRDLLAALFTAALLPGTAEARLFDLPLERSASFCSAGKAFGMRLGSREDPGMHMSPTSSLLPLPEEFRPFDNAEVVVTLNTRRKHTVHGEADFTNDGEAEDAKEEVKAALVGAGWTDQGSPAENATAERLTYGAQALDKQKARGMVVDLFTLGSRLYFSCSDAALMQQAQREFPLPPPTASPR